LLYTPLKPVTSLCSLVGAVPGALPPVAGWAAARGSIGPEAWVLFAIMYLWQIPHTLAIGRMYRDDYARAGIRVLPVVDGDGSSTAIHAVVNCLALLPVALLPTLLGMAGPLYFATALVLGLGFLWSAIGLARRRSLADARRLLVTSLIYLPVLLATMALDKLPITR
jgi:protoheme IX farnesyltransferase